MSGSNRLTIHDGEGTDWQALWDFQHGKSVDRAIAPEVAQWRHSNESPQGDYRGGEPDQPINLHLGPNHWEQWGDFEQEWIRIEEPPSRVFGPIPTDER